MRAALLSAGGLAAYRDEYRRFRRRPRQPLDGMVTWLLIGGATVLLAVLLINAGLVMVQGVEAPYRQFERLGSTSWR